MWDSPLTMTGVIATVLSLLFAGAAYWNARRHRLHAAPPAPAKPHGGERIQIRPPEERKTPKVASRSGSQIFKQVGPTGQPADKDVPDDSGYVWE